MTEVQESAVMVCKSCGWGAATVDGYCLECIPVDDEDDICPQCGAAWCCEDTHGP